MATDISLNINTGAFSISKNHKKTIISFADLLAEDKERLFCEGIPLTFQFGTPWDESVLPNHEKSTQTDTNRACINLNCLEEQSNQQPKIQNHIEPTPKSKIPCFSIYDDEFAIEWSVLEHRKHTTQTTMQTIRPYMPHIYNISAPLNETMDQIPTGFEHFSLTDEEYIAHLSGSNFNDDIMRQHAIIEGYINGHLFHILLDTGADISVIHTQVADIVPMECFTHNGINITSFGGDATRTYDTGKIKITLKNAVYFGEFWICNFDPTPKFHLILGMDFLSKAGAIIDTHRRVVTFADDHEIYMLPSSLEHVPHDEIPIFLPQNSYIAAGGFLDIPIPRFRNSSNLTYWMNRAKNWVSSLMITNNDVPSHIRLTNISDKSILARSSAQYAACLITPGFLPIDRNMVRVHSNRYKEWQHLAFEGSFTQSRQRNHTPKVKNTASNTSNKTKVRQILKTQPAVHSLALSSTLNVDQSKMDKEWVIHEKDLFDPTSDDLAQQLAFLPDLANEPHGEVNVDELDFGEDDLSPSDKAKMRAVLEYHASCFISSGNGCPPAAIGTVCDIDVGDIKPIAIRARRVRPEWMGQLRDLLFDLLKYNLIQFSNSPWASPIVIVLKKNKKDIRLCIDYRAVNSHTKILQSPMPILDSFLANYAGMKWFLSLDCASGFWVVPLSKRAQKISAFICPLGHFEWLRMPFGLKNAPMIYQRMVNNALFGFVSMPHGQDAVLPSGEPFDLFANDPINTSNEYSPTKPPDLHNIQPFKAELRNITQTSFVDDVTAAAPTWDAIVEMVDIVLTLLRRWNISISALKSSFGKRSVDFLGHIISHLGLHAKPKDIQSFIDLPFPTSLQAMQSFLGCLNFFSRFIDNFSIAAGCLYELNDAQLKSGRNLDKARQAFTHLKEQYVNMPILKHANRSEPFHIVLYTTPWAISATICQMHDDLLHPVRFCSRILKQSELRHESWAKEILALLRVLRIGYYELSGAELVVYTQFQVLKWATEFKKTRKDHIQWSVLLAPWNIKFVTIDSLDDKLKFAALLTTSMTPPDKLMDALGHLRPNKLDQMPITNPIAPLPILERTAVARIMTFDGSVCNTERLGSYGVVIWKLPEWTIEYAFNGLVTGATNNVAEYNGCIAGLRKAISMNLLDLIVLGDSQLVLYQILGHKLCHKDHLKPLLAEAVSLSKQFRSIQFHHILREFNAPADALARMALESRNPMEEPNDALRTQLCDSNTVAQLLYKSTAPVVYVLAHQKPFWSTRFVVPGPTHSIFHIEEFGPRMELLAAAQEREIKLASIKEFLRGNTTNWSRKRYTKFSKLAKDFNLTDEGVLRKLVWSTRHSKEAKPEWRVVIPDSMVQHVLAHCHSSIQGGHQGRQRTYERVRNMYFWHNMYQDVTHYVENCLDCITSRPPPTKAMMAPTPGSLEPEFPFHTVGMDFATEMPQTSRGNKLLCVWTCWFTGYVICAALPDKSAQTVAEAYERCVFRRFGASVLIRHDRDPTFMSETFKAFNDMLNQRQLPTFAYRPQANGTTERMIQTVIRAVKKYSTLEGNLDWDILAERLAFAINTSYDTIRKNTPFYLVHGWDPLTTLQATMSDPSTSPDGPTAWQWRQAIHSDYQHCLRLASYCLDEAKQKRAEEHNITIEKDTRIREGDAVWLYIDQVKPGAKKKLCHLWHGPFRVIAKRHTYSSTLDLESLLPTKANRAKAIRRVHPEVHDSRLMLFRNTPRRPTHSLNEELPAIDFNVTSFLPHDSYEPGLILTAVHDVRVGYDSANRGYRHREYLVSIHNKHEKQWIMNTKLPQSSLIDDFERNRLNINRFNQMLDAEPDQIDYTVEVDPTQTEPPSDTNHATDAPVDRAPNPNIAPQHQRQTSVSEYNIQSIIELLELKSIVKDKFWLVKWSHNLPPQWVLETTLCKIPTWTIAKRAFDAKQTQRSIHVLHSQLTHPLTTIHEHDTNESTSQPSF